MSGIYGKSRQEAKKIQEEAQKSTENAEWQRKAAERRMKKDLEWKFKEFMRVLQTKVSDERIKRSVYSLSWSVITPIYGD
jgi:F0F1-type ATP synthase membrane subunit b/b'